MIFNAPNWNDFGAPNPNVVRNQNGPPSQGGLPSIHRATITPHRYSEDTSNTGKSPFREGDVEC